MKTRKARELKQDIKKDKKLHNLILTMQMIREGKDNVNHSQISSSQLSKEKPAPLSPQTLPLDTPGALKLDSVGKISNPEGFWHFLLFPFHSVI